MAEKDRVNQLEDELKVLKNELQAVLLDIRESYLNRENPFTPDVSAIPIQPAIAAAITTQQAPAPSPSTGKRKPARDQQDELSDTEDMEDDEEESASEEKKRPRAKKPAKPADEGESVGEEELDAGAEAAHEEVKGASRSDAQPVSRSQPRKPDNGSKGDGKVDLITIAGLTQWVMDTVKRLGREKTETILEISEIAGLVAPELKNVLVKFADRAPDDYHGGATTQDYIATLIELEKLLGINNRSEEMALLSIICQEARP